ncbi:dehydrogenase/reductase SDR family member 9-like [Bradysia coprophila]|uniref:dehydrogenase/reductase SDR family member 9-like n=1 Tax=Bradysia coprophila TaxID=38358 RepID=UPI00187DA7B4|nr:dehydrogenase/reductase SDR family member 9-like [Bradysia coprophila]
MFLIKAILHFVLFVLSSVGIHYYFELNVCVTLLTLIHCYAASYYVSLWFIKFAFLFPCTKIKSDNKCVLVTGCDTGFGHQTALLLNKNGFKVFAACIDSNGEGAIALRHKAHYPAKMIVIRMDVTSDKDIEAAYETVKSSMANGELLFGLVNNAGIAKATEFEWCADIRDGKKVIEVNLMGMIYVTRRFIPLIRQAKGRIINIESVSAFLPTPYSPFYGTSKYGAAGFSENLRVSMHKFGVSVVSLMPFFYKTPICDANRLADEFESSYKTSSEEVRRAYGEQYVKNAQAGMSLTKYAFKSQTVPKVIASALTVYEPDPKYIVAPLLVQPGLRLLLWLPKETRDAYFQLTAWFTGTHKAYPD